MATLYAFAGRKGSGKDTAAEVLRIAGFHRVAFADPMKDALLALNPFIPSNLSGDGPHRLYDLVHAYGWDNVKRTYPEVRRLLQEYGTGIRAYDSDFWVRSTGRQIASLLERDNDVVVTDVRFPNEARAIHRLGGKVIDVHRVGTDVPDPHPSEWPLRRHLVDVTILNDGTVDDLHLKIANYAL